MSECFSDDCRFLSGIVRGIYFHISTSILLTSAFSRAKIFDSSRLYIYFSLKTLKSTKKCEFSVKMCCPYLNTLVSGSPVIQNGKLVGAVTHVILLASTATCAAALRARLRRRSARGEICALSQASELAVSLRLIM